MASAHANGGFMGLLKRYPKTFWVANVMELFERWAYYGMFGVLSLYLTDPVSKGGLGFSQEQRGALQGVVTAIMYVLPILGGAIADRFGFRKVLIAAFSILTVAYFMMGQFTSYTGIWLAFLLVAVGAAIFKPVISGTVAKTTDDKTASVGFGIFYMMVNIGGFVGPFVAGVLRKLDWSYVFIMSTVVIAFNLIPTLLIYREPGREEGERPPLLQSLVEIWQKTLSVFKDWKFMLFLLIFSGFWTMFIQIFITLPVFIEQWVDTTVLYDAVNSIWPALAETLGKADERTINPEMMINLDAGAIIFFQLLVSYAVMRMRPISSMVLGIAIASIGTAMAGLSSSGWMCVAAILVFAFGEMASSPKMTEYVGRIAPKGKTALYMGYAFLPVAFGNLLGGVLSGGLYGAYSDKFVIAADYLKSQGMAAEKVQNLLQSQPLELWNQAVQSAGGNAVQAREMLWQSYHPQQVWFWFMGLGILTGVLLFIYDRVILPTAKPEED